MAHNELCNHHASYVMFIVVVKLIWFDRQCADM